MKPIQYWLTLSFAVMLYVVLSIVLVLQSLPSFIKEVAAQPAKKGQQSAKMVAEHFWSFKPKDFDEMLNSIAIARGDLQQKNLDLLTLKNQLDDEKKYLVGLKAEIESIQENLNKQIITIHESEQKSLKSMAKTYANMEAETAVKILEEMDDRTLVKVLSMFKPEPLAAILTVFTNNKKDKTKVKRAANLMEMLRLKQKG